ncbi:MAG: hypothetical protein HC847_02890 [Hydrococcus sp. RU_2_2]|nr:hypothetical protein [Hydrococcus sp. RU_2_2]NJP18122.1 hypothetical protein [Hydrococcus sp. CRU_1_1]
MNSNLYTVLLERIRQEKAKQEKPKKQKSIATKADNYTPKQLDLGL